MLGVNHGGSGGAFWEKLHPATYLAALAFALQLLSRRKRWAYLENLCVKFPGAAYFVVVWLLLIAFASLVQHTPIAPLIETYLIAVVALFMVDDLAKDWREFLRRFLHGVLFVNAMLGIAEFYTQLKLFPDVNAVDDAIGDYRSTALLGHPLANAAVTGLYILCLVLGGDGKLTPLWRALMLLPQICSMAAFGGRTSILVTSLILAIILIKSAALLLIGKRFDLRSAVTMVVLAPLAFATGFYVFSAGFLDKLVQRFIDDNGSAEARVVMFRLFDLFDFNEILWGPRPEIVNSALITLGIRIGIENTWIALAFQYGLIMAGIFIAGMFMLFWEYWRRSHSGAYFLFLFFFILITSAIGLSVKTMLFVEFSLLLLFIFPAHTNNS